MENKRIIAAMLIALMVSFGCTDILFPPKAACTSDVYVCPDGTSVGRDPANSCQFFQCPIPDDNDTPPPPPGNNAAESGTMPQQEPSGGSDMPPPPPSMN